MRRSIMLFNLALALALLWSCGAGDGDGQRCTLNSDCAAAELCIDQRCVTPCRQDRDCGFGQVCTERGCETSGGAGGDDATPPHGGEEGCDPAVEDTCLVLCETCEHAASPEDPAAVDPDYAEGVDFGSGGSACPSGTLVSGNRCRYGTDLGSYRGVSTYSNFMPHPASRHGVDGGRLTGRFGYHFQCVEYVVRFMAQARDYHGLNGTGNARNWWHSPGTEAGRSLRRMSNGGPDRPSPEDIIVFDGGTYGHIGIIRDVGDNHVSIIHQNWFHNTAEANTRLAMQVSGGQYTIANLSTSYPVLGWLRDPRVPEHSCSSAADCPDCYTCNGGSCQPPPSLPVPTLQLPADGAVESPDRVSLSWSHVPQATRYRVRIGRTAESVVANDCIACTEIEVESSNSAEWRPSGNAEGDWFWSVRAGNACSGSDWASPRRVRLAVQSCTGPSSQPCGNCGTQTRTCTNGQWSSWSACTGQGECSPGSSESCGSSGTRTCSPTCSWGVCSNQTCSGPTSQACGNCGTQTRTCSNGQWSSWSTCTGQGQCSPGSSESCGSNGTRTCSTTCSWGTCTGQTCPGSASQSCGNCGTQTRTCTNGQWSGWSTCSGQGVCSPGSSTSCGNGGTQTCSASCSWGTCTGSATITANYTSTLSPAGTCNPTTSRAIYRGRASSISGNNATLVFEKCSGAGSPNIDAGRRWWVVVGDSAFPSEANVPHYVSRRDGTVSSTTTRLTVSNVPVWPSEAAFASAPCGDTRHLFLITDGGDAPFQRRWFQYRAVTFTKSC